MIYSSRSQSGLCIRIQGGGGGRQNADVSVTPLGRGPAISFHKSSLGSVGAQSAENRGSQSNGSL